MAEVLRTKTTSEPRGFMKALVGADGRVLGFAAFGADAGEWMGTVQVAMLAGTPFTTLRDAVFAHPTMTEGLNFLFEGMPSASRDIGEPEYAGATRH
jgi:pyruvate/2-oxoglutarate dehydrogenase complex dihydrolipoamide dehydrogenase (E3) component